MDVVPFLMRLMRTKFRETRAGELTMAQFRTLAFIDSNQGASLSEVAGHIGLGLPSVSKLVNKLVIRELIIRDLHGTDRRRICLKLTARGKRELDAAYQHAHVYFAEKFSQMSLVDRSRVLEALLGMRGLFDLPSPKTVTGISEGSH